jgi:hypothetical protein
VQKSPYQNFETQWTKTMNWARGQGIPMSSIYPVYQLDSRRLMTPGEHTMGEYDRTRAILASYNPNNVTPLPTDVPASGIGGFFHNVMHDATNIFTGLQPTHMVTSIFDSVKNTIEHPNWLLDPSKNTLAQLIPGVSLLGEYEQGGMGNVFAHPLISFLNVLGIASAGTSLVAHTALGDTLAASLDVGSRQALARMGPTGILSKVVGRVPTRTEGLSLDANGLPTWGNLTVAQRMKNWAGTKGLGSDIATLNAKIAKEARVSGSELEQLVADGAKANAKLADKTLDIRSEAEGALYGVAAGTKLDYVHAAYNLAVFSGKSWSELATNDLIPSELKEMMPHYQAAEEWIEKQNLATGELTRIRLPDGTYGVYSQAQAKPLVSAQKAVVDTEKTAVEASRTVDRMSEEIQRNDTVAKPALDLLSQVAGTARATLSEQLRGTLGPTDRVHTRFGSVSRNSVARLLDTVPAKVTMTQARMANDIYGVGGLIDQVAEAYSREDFVAFRNLSLKLVKKLRSKQLAGEETSALGTRLVTSQFLVKSRTVAENLYTYGKARAQAEKTLKDAMGDRRLGKALAAHESALKNFERVVRNNPAAAWQPLYVKLVNDKIASDERTTVSLEMALAGLKKSGKVTDEALDNMRKDPGRVIDLVRTYMRAGHESPFGATLDQSLIREMEQSALDEIKQMRAEGHVPHYVPNFSSRDSLGAYDPSEVGREIHLNPTRYMTPDAVRDRMMDMSNTIYDIYAGQTRAMSQRIQSDSIQHLIDDYLIPTHGYKQSDLVEMILREHPMLGGEAAIATNEAYLANLLENTYGLTRFDPSTYGLATSRHIIHGGETYWMSKDLIKGLNDIVKKSELESTGAISAATNIFRTSVLGYSPRFIAHILFGGSFLVALREPASFLRMGQALKMLKDPEFRAQIHTRSTQVGKDDPIAFGVRSFHQEGGKTMGRMWAHEMMDKLGLPPDKMTSWLKVIPQMTFKLTNTITDMQRAQIVLAGIRSTEKRGEVLDEVTGKMVAYTPERALEEGMRRANKVMGDLSHMTPLERNVITTAIPFYGWTKHVLEYVATYPVDHPYRAVFLANLANMNSDEVSKGLYTRIQNLFFLGSPDEHGNVSAIDTRALNPLRDVANYATIGGLISMLNPVISAPFAMVDPEAVFGSNVLYPNITYNALYGTKTAAPAGSALTVAEQFVPELTGIDAALGISAQYRNLRRTNPNSFAKAIFGALNIPFAQVQHLNLKQIAAQQEIDRAQQAYQASQQAFSSGDFGALAGYGDVPNPLQPIYNISPAQLQAIYDSTLKQAGGLPPSEVLPTLPAPPGL